MPESEIDSGSESDMSETARAARDRLAPKTQRDYASFMNGLSKFALDRRVQFGELIQNDKVLLPVPLSIGKAYLCHCRDARVAWPLDPRTEASRTGLKHYSIGKIDGVIAAIKYSYCKLSAAMPPNEVKFYNDFQHSYRNILAQAKACGEYPAQSGTVAIAMASVVRLLNAALRHVPTGRGAKESSVRRVWLYILLAIATCGRGERVGRVQFQFISWAADCLSVQIPTSKSDLEGLMSYAKLCGANPWNPVCCLPTALGVEFLSRDDSSSVDFLFGNFDEETKSMVTQMQTALKTILNDVGEDNLGATFDRLTGHFLKKTAIGFMRSNHECISHDSRELRADHKVGPYNQRSEQDGVVGRVLAFLKPGSVEFACAPPHFHPDVVAAIPWAVIVPTYNQYPLDTKLAIHACVASVIHNAEFIMKNLSTSHPFHGCHLMKTQLKWVKLLQPHVLGGRSGFKSIMEATGQSLISKIAVDLEAIRKEGSREAITCPAALVEQMCELQHAVTDLKNVIVGQASQPTSAVAPAHIPRIYIGYITEKFPFPVGLGVEDGWRRWHCGEKPLRSIIPKMLLSSLSAAERVRQMCLRRKFKAVMEILQGQTDDKTVDIDPNFVWQTCWTRAVALFQIPLPCSWTISTAYDFFCRSSALVKAAREAATVRVPDVAIAAAATAAKAAQDARTFAVAASAQHPVRVSDSVAAAGNVVDESASVMSAAHVSNAIESIRLHSVQIGGENVAVDDNLAVAPIVPIVPNVVYSIPPPTVLLHAVWPRPQNEWMLGAVQCARVCTSCRTTQWQRGDKQIFNHYLHHHCNVPHLKRGPTGRSWMVQETAWCVQGVDAEGTPFQVQGLPWMPVELRQTISRKRPRPDANPGAEAAQQEAARAYADALMRNQAASELRAAQEQAVIVYNQRIRDIPDASVAASPSPLSP
jgi:hypothetical protein